MMLVIAVLALSVSAAIANNVYSIAFTSALSGDVRLEHGQCLKYQLTLFNSGNAYDNKTGIFTCPQSGIYQFIIIHAVTNGARDDARLQIVHNQDFVVSLYGGGSYTSGGNSAIIHLKKGDNIWVRALGRSSVRGDALYTTFSGFLIASSFEQNV